MIKILDNIRIPDKNANLKTKIINTILIFLLGSILGIFSKWLDNLVINDMIFWQKIIWILDLRNIFSSLEIWLFFAIIISVFSKTPLRASLNVFLFFAWMTVSYHLITIYFSGFNPKSYMMIWYGITLISPILAFICWYAKGKNIISLIISSLILAVMLTQTFSIWFWYFNFKSIINFLIFIGTILVLHVNFKNTNFSLIIALIFSFLIKWILLHIL